MCVGVLKNKFSLLYEKKGHSLVAIHALVIKILVNVHVHAHVHECVLNRCVRYLLYFRFIFPFIFNICVVNYIEPSS